MAGVERLINRLSDIEASGGLAECDLFLALKSFFEKEEVQDLIVKLNTDRLYEHSTDRYGILMPRYADSTLKRKKGRGVNATKSYTYYDSGSTYDNMEIIVDDLSVAIYPDHESAPSYAHMLDGRAWGLTESDFEEIRPDMKKHIVNEIRNYLNG